MFFNVQCLLFMGETGTSINTKFGCNKCSFCFKYRWDVTYSLNEQCPWTLKLDVINIHFASNIHETLNIPLMHYVQCILTLNLDVINIHFASNIGEMLNIILMHFFTKFQCDKSSFCFKYSHSEQAIFSAFLVSSFCALHGFTWNCLLYNFSCS